MDRYYTPKTVAELLISDVPASVKSVLDAAAGNGALLEVASKAYPDAAIWANDIDSEVVEVLGKHEDWHVSGHDFFSASFRQLFRNVKVDLVVLNPPFSGRGAAVVTVPTPEGDLRCSLPLAFVLGTSLLVTAAGVIRVVLPAGSLTAEKDEIAWKLLRKRFRVSVRHVLPRGTFDGVFAECVIVELVNSSSKVGRTFDTSQSHVERPSVELVRGTLPIYRALAWQHPGGIPVIHNTSLKAARAVRSASGLLVRPPVGFREISGDSILLPRIGLPKAAYTKRRHLRGRSFLSDCVVALTGESENLDALVTFLHENWNFVSEAYGGSCAKYTTVKRLRRLVDEAGFNLSIRA